MTNERFFDMKAREAGFKLYTEEQDFINALRSLVYYVLHGESIEYEPADEELGTEFYRYSDEEECFILFGLDCNESLQVAYLLNQFGIELVYRNGDYRVYIKK